VCCSNHKIGSDISSPAEIKGNGLSRFSACHRLIPIAYGRAIAKSTSRKWPYYKLVIVVTYYRQTSMRYAPVSSCKNLPSGAWLVLRSRSLRRRRRQRSQPSLPSRYICCACAPIGLLRCSYDAHAALQDRCCDSPASDQHELQGQDPASPSINCSQMDQTEEWHHTRQFLPPRARTSTSLPRRLIVGCGGRRPRSSATGTLSTTRCTRGHDLSLSRTSTLG
jgi:hypothetical protein